MAERKRFEWKLRSRMLQLGDRALIVAILNITPDSFSDGADIINDPNRFTWDTAMAKTVARLELGLILNHMRGTPETWAKLGPIKDLIVTVRQDLEASISRALRDGVEKVRVVIDPGIGF